MQQRTQRAENSGEEKPKRFSGAKPQERKYEHDDEPNEEVVKKFKKSDRKEPEAKAEQPKNSFTNYPMKLFSTERYIICIFMDGFGLFDNLNYKPVKSIQIEQSYPLNLIYDSKIIDYKTEEAANGENICKKALLLTFADRIEVFELDNFQQQIVFQSSQLIRLLTQTQHYYIFVEGDIIFNDNDESQFCPNYVKLANEDFKVLDNIPVEGRISFLLAEELPQNELNIIIMYEYIGVCEIESFELSYANSEFKMENQKFAEVNPFISGQDLCFKIDEERLLITQTGGIYFYIINLTTNKIIDISCSTISQAYGEILRSIEEQGNTFICNLGEGIYKFQINEDNEIVEVQSIAEKRGLTEMCCSADKFYCALENPPKKSLIFKDEKTFTVESIYGKQEG